MRHHMRDPLDVGRHAIDENALLQFQPHCKALLLGECQGAFEIGPRNRMQADDTAVAGHTTGAVERHYAVVRNSFKRSEIVRGAPRGDIKSRTPRSCACASARSAEAGISCVLKLISVPSTSRKIARIIVCSFSSPCRSPAWRRFPSGIRVCRRSCGRGQAL